MKIKLFTLLIIFITSGSAFSQPSDAAALEQAKKGILNSGKYISISSMKVKGRESKVWNSDKERWDYIVNMHIEGQKKLEASGLVVKCSEPAGVTYSAKDYSYISWFLAGTPISLEPIPAPDQAKYKGIIENIVAEQVAKSSSTYPVIDFEISPTNQAIKYGNSGLYSGKWYQWTQLDETGRIMFNFKVTTVCKEEKPRKEWVNSKVAYNYYKITSTGNEAFYMYWNKDLKKYYYKASEMYLFECHASKPADNGEMHFETHEKISISADEYGKLLASTIGKSAEETASAQSSFSKPNFPSNLKTDFTSEEEMATYIYKTIITSNDAEGIGEYLRYFLNSYYKSTGYNLNKQGTDLVNAIKDGIKSGNFQKQYCADFPVWDNKGQYNWQNLYSPTGYAAKWFDIAIATHEGALIIKSMNVANVGDETQKINCDKTKFTGPNTKTPIVPNEKSNGKGTKVDLKKLKGKIGG